MTQLMLLMMSRAEHEKNLEAVGQLGKVKVDIAKATNADAAATVAASDGAATNKEALLSDVKKKIDIDDTKLEKKSLAARADAILGKVSKEQKQQQPKQDKKDKSNDDAKSVSSTGDNTTSSSAAAQQVPVKDRISVPNENDVLFGRGKPYQNHPGNMRLHKLVDFHREKYLKSKRFDKCVIAKQIVRVIKEASGRFLKRAGDGLDYWVVVSDEVAREKVSHALRSKVRMGKSPSSSASAMSMIRMGGGADGGRLGGGAGGIGGASGGGSLSGAAAPSGAAMAAALGGGLHPSLFGGGGGLADTLRNSILPPFRGAAFGAGGLQSSFDQQGNSFPQRLDNMMQSRGGGNLMASLGNNNMMSGLNLSNADMLNSLGLGGLAAPAAALSQAVDLERLQAAGLLSSLPPSVNALGSDISPQNMFQAPSGQLSQFSTAANLELAIEMLRRRRTQQQQQQGNME